jgi:segregation and condensation protein A
VPDALRHIAALLARHPAPLSLARCLPPIPAQAPDRPLRLRAALASSFAAGLEMAWDGTAVLEQAAPFAAIGLRGR